MNSVQQFRDVETTRRQRNLTESQQRKVSNTVEGVVVNNMAKTSDGDMNEIYDTLLISKNSNIPYPSQIGFSEPNYDAENSSSSALKKLCAVSVGVLGVVAGITYIVASASAKRVSLPSWKTLPEVPRNIAINEESFFATYAMVQNPNTKTILGATGVFALGVAGYVAKSFVDGFKEIWVKRQEAKTQRNLQEKLIAVETQSFAGKTQIQRAMLNDAAKKLEQYLNIDNSKPAFRQFISFGAKETSLPKKNNSVAEVFIAGASAIAIAALTYFSLKNLQKTATQYSKYEINMKEIISNLIKNSSDKMKEEDLGFIKKIMTSLSPDKKYIEETLGALNMDKEKKSEYINTVIHEVEKITQEAAEAIAGKPGHKASMYSHVDDLRGHFYNWIVNFDNSILGYLFGGLTAVTAFGYTGRQFVDALKQAQVIKINAETELSLQKRLVEVEMKNYYAKKTSVINPLLQEFEDNARKGKEKSELKVMAENILLEIKNGPPYVYS